MALKTVYFPLFLCFISLCWADVIAENKTETLSERSERPKVNVTVIYATLCPDSKGFIGEQLWPTYQSNLGSIMNIEFVPWGKAKYLRDGESWTFICQHGPRECLGNKIHACVLDLYREFNQSFSYIHCSMTGEERNAPDEFEACAVKNNMDWKNISECVNSPKGNDLLQAHGVTTEKAQPPLVFVPWIIINDKFRGPTLELSLDNLPKVICDAYGEPRLPECSKQ